jgi:endo-1,4-beta-xylanase
VYTIIDAWAKHGVKVHATELTMDPDYSFASDVKQADMWTPELVADYFEKYYTVLFSHPEVAAINYWDLGPSMVRGTTRSGGIRGGIITGRAGLLDPTNNDEPRPVYHRLKELITQRWMTKFTTGLKPDGAVAFRGFHGDYEVVVTLPGGKTLRGKFSVKPGEGNAYQLKLSEASNSLATGR